MVIEDCGRGESADSQEVWGRVFEGEDVVLEGLSDDEGNDEDARGEELLDRTAKRALLPIKPRWPR
jgi:hypothetical protein